DPPRPFAFDRAGWVRELREQTERVGAHPELFDSHVRVSVDHEEREFASTEGTRLVTERVIYALHVQAWARAPDGMLLENSRDFYGAKDSELPRGEELARRIDVMVAELLALRQAPVLDPYTGPALLEPEAAGVLFHEAVGHRLEGERQNDDKDGHTFKGQVGKPILPFFLTILDDPTEHAAGPVSPNGYYRFDDQGVPGQRTAAARVQGGREHGRGGAGARGGDRGDAAALDQQDHRHRRGAARVQRILRRGERICAGEHGRADGAGERDRAAADSQGYRPFSGAPLALGEAAGVRDSLRSAGARRGLEPERRRVESAPDGLVLEVRQGMSRSAAEGLGEAGSAAHAPQQLADRLVAGDAHEQIEGAVRRPVHGLLLVAVQLRVRTEQIGAWMIGRPLRQLLHREAPPALVGGHRGHSLPEPERWFLRCPGRVGPALHQLVHERVRQLVREQLGHVVILRRGGADPAARRLQQHLIAEGPGAQPGVAVPIHRVLERGGVGQYGDEGAWAEGPPT